MNWYLRRKSAQVFPPVNELVDPDDGVLAGVGRAGEPQRDHFNGVRDDEILRCQVGELRMIRRRGGEVRRL